jgi:TetR/AcrR family transcriptional regulator, transcriptional repressor for nem operon
MPPTQQRGNADTAERILDSAERLVQSRGFNGFSYATVAAELGVTKASLHYHFPGKAELGQELIGRYAARFADALDQIDARGGDAPAKLTAYARIYADVLRDRRMCLCGMLAADYDTLPQPMRDAVLRFFDDNETWLKDVFEQGQKDGSLRLDGSPREAARALVGGLEGALLIARPYDDPTRFEAAAARLLTSLAGATPATHRLSTARVTAPDAKRSRSR